MDEVVIRSAVGADAESIARLWLALVAYHRALDPDLPDAAPEGAKRYANQVWQRYDDPHTGIFVAELDKRVIGYVLGLVVDLVPDFFAPEPGGFLADIFVEEPYRHLGVGRRLVAALQDWFRQKKVRYFDWNVAVSNRQAVAFWRGIGGRDVMIRMRVDLEDKTE